MVIAGVMLTVPVEVVSIMFDPLVDAQEMVPLILTVPGPASNVYVPPKFPEFIVKRPVMVNELPAVVILRVGEEALLPMVKLAHVKVPLTVTTWFDAIITLSVELGAIPPTQVAPALQTPVAFEVMVAAVAP